VSERDSEHERVRKGGEGVGMGEEEKRRRRVVY